MSSILYYASPRIYSPIVIHKSKEEWNKIENYDKVMEMYADAIFAKMGLI